MALWGKTDATGSKPKYLSTADKANAVFVSAEEAVLKTNKDKGITGAGWWLTKSYTDADGKIRYKSELLIAMTVANSVSGDAADDAIAADVEVTITIATQPANQTTVSGGATFGITASVSSGTLTYQWQKKPAAATGRWANVASATSATLALTGQLAANTGDQYRVVMQSSSGAAAVTSSVATLTFGS
jgi:hypothetical protein